MALCLTNGLPTKHSRGPGKVPGIRIVSDQATGWHHCLTEMREVTAFALHFGAQAGTSGSTFGAVCIRPAELATVIQTGNRSRQAERFAAAMEPVVEEAKRAEAVEHSDFQRSQARRLIAAKHAGRVEEKHDPHVFTTVQILHPDDFSREALRNRLPTFKGALYAPCKEAECSFHE